MIHLHRYRGGGLWTAETPSVSKIQTECIKTSCSVHKLFTEHFQNAQSIHIFGNKLQEYWNEREVLYLRDIHMFPDIKKARLSVETAFHKIGIVTIPIDYIQHLFKESKEANLKETKVYIVQTRFEIPRQTTNY